MQRHRHARRHSKWKRQMCHTSVRCDGPPSCCGSGRTHICTWARTVIQTAGCLSVRVALVNDTQRRDARTPYTQSVVAASRSAQYPHNYENGDYCNCCLHHFPGSWCKGAWKRPDLIIKWNWTKREIVTTWNIHVETTYAPFSWSPRTKDLSSWHSSSAVLALTFSGGGNNI